MKKVLLGTTAIVAASILAAPAMAQNKPISLGLGGYFQFAYDLVNQRDRANVGGPGTGGGALPGAASTGAYNEAGAYTRDHGVMRDAEIWFLGATTFDNGLRVGARIELEGESQIDQIDQSWIWFDSAYGRSELGLINGAAARMMYSSPNIMPGWNSIIVAHKSHAGANNGTWGFTGGFNGRANLAGDSEKLSYFTPRNWLPLGNGGFQVGVSYTPLGCEQNLIGRSALNGTTLGGYGSCANTYIGFDKKKNVMGRQSQIWDLAANYVGKISDVDVAVYAGANLGKLEAKGGTWTSAVLSTTNYGTSGAGSTAGIGAWSAEQNSFANRDRTIWNTGFNLGYMGFTLGGLYRYDNTGINRTGGDFKAYDINANTQAALSAVTMATRNDSYAIGLKYDFAPFSVGVDYQFSRTDIFRTDGTAAGANNYTLGNQTHTNLIFAGGYQVGPGVRLAAGVKFFSLGNNMTDNGTADNRAAIQGAYTGAAVNSGQVYRIATELNF